MLRVRRLRVGARLPERAHADDAGLDLFSAEDVTIPVNGRRLVGCGIALAIPRGYVGSVRPRSGLAHTHGVTVLNAPGTIDPGYRGEVKVLLANFGGNPFTVRPGDRIAQLVLELVGYLEPVEVEELEATERGTGGFGSTGK